jgi:hypothetical protein
MRSSARIVTLLVLVTLLVSFTRLAAGQSVTDAGAAGQRVGQPYTAEFKITSERVLANGTLITREKTETDAMDSEGRRLTITKTPATETRPERSVYHVFDPVARTNTSWTQPGERATVTPMPPLVESGQTGQVCWSAAPGVGSGSSTAAAGPRETPAGPYGVSSSGATAAPRVEGARTPSQRDVHEDLGMQTFEGLQAKGTRITHTTPAGAIGNDQPLVRTMEMWRAQPSGLVVHEVIDDPQTGKRTRELVQFSNREPYSGSFLPPEGYENVTQELHQIPCAR